MNGTPRVAPTWPDDATRFGSTSRNMIVMLPAPRTRLASM